MIISKELLKAQLKRVFFSYRMLGIFLLGGFFIAYQQLLLEIAWDGSAFSALLEYSNSPAIYIYILVLPLYASLIGATIYEEDIHSGFYFFLRPRLSARAYFYTGGLTAFLLGSLACFIPIFMQQISAFMTYPARIYPYLESPFISRYGLYQELFYYHPYLHLFISTWRFVFFAGLISLLAYSISLYAKNRGSQIIIVFMVFLILWIMTTLVDCPGLSHLDYLKISADDLRFYGDVRPMMLIQWVLMFFFSIKTIRKKVEGEVL